MSADACIAEIRVGDPFPDDASPETLYVVRDHLGSSVVVSDEDGQWINREEYTPFGETSFGSFRRKKYRFTGQPRDDESGLCLHGARYLAPWLGRWTSCDPLVTGGGGTPPDQAYSYVDNRPMVANDPTGQFLNLIAGAIGAAAGLVIGGGIEAARQLYSDGKITSWGRIGAMAAGGAIAGGIGGLTMGASLAVQAVGAGVGAAVGGAVTRGLLGEKQTVEGVVKDAIIGVATFGLLKGGSALIGAVRNNLRAGALAAADEAGEQIQNVMRNGGPTGGSKNVSAALVDEPGYAGRTPTRARSGQGTPAPMHQSVPHSPVPNDRSLSTYLITTEDEQKGIIKALAEGKPDPRVTKAFDTEIKHLEEIQTHLPANPTGTVYMGSKLPICPSCTTAIYEFLGNNPGVKVGVFAPVEPIPNLAAPPLIPPGAGGAASSSVGASVGATLGQGFSPDVGPGRPQGFTIEILHWK